MNKLYFGYLVGVSMLSIIGFDAGQAQAQTTTSDREDTATAHEEIIVQARRRGELQQDVPLAVNAVTSENIEKLNIREFKDIETLVPGLQLASSANGIGAQASLRGVAYDVNASGNNGTIEFYLNDAPLSAGILFQSMFDVGQIEVLRGPQGTLRGRASPSGSITVTTRRPDLYEAGFTGSITRNDLHGWNVNGAINVPIIADKLGVRIAGVLDRSRGNRVTSINSDEKPYLDTDGLRVSVAAEPFDFLSLFGSYTHTERSYRQFAQVESLSETITGAPASPVTIKANDRLATGFNGYEARQNYEVFNWQAQLRFAGQKLDYIGSHNVQEYLSIDPNDKAGFFDATFPAALRDATLYTVTLPKQTTHEIRLSNDERVAGMFDYVVGFLHNTLRNPTQLTRGQPLFLGVLTNGTYTPTPGALAPAPLGGPVASVPILRSGETTEQSIFGNITAHLGEATELSAGIRFIDYKAVGSLSIAGVEQVAAAEDRNPKHTIYSASVKHKITPDVMVYASFGSSWRPGSSTNPAVLLDLVPANDGLPASFYYPGDESSKSYEIGFKSEWFDRRLRLNVTAYHQDYKNYAYSSPNVYVAGVGATSGVNGVFQAAPGLAVGVPARVRGVEGEIAFKATPNWNLAATASYSKSKIKNGTIPCNKYGNSIPTYDEVLDVNDGQRVATCTVNYSAGITAPFSLSVQSEYTQPLSAGTEGFVRGLLTYTGNSKNDPANAYDDVEKYAMTNLFLGIKGSNNGWEIAGYVKNLFDMERVLSRGASPLGVSYTVVCSPLIPGIGAACPGGLVRASGSNASTYRAITMTPPREFGITARLQFGSR